MADNLEIRAVMVDDTAPGADAVIARLDSIGSKGTDLGKTLEGLGSKMKSLGSSMTMGITLPIVGIAAASAKMAADFQQQMEILHTQANVPQAALAGLSTSIENLAGQVGFSPTSLAEAMYHIESNGKGVITAAQAMDQLKVSAQAAAMSGANLDDTTYTLSSTLASGITGAKGYADMMGVLNGIVGAGDMRFQNLNAAIGTGFLATAAQFGISVQSMGAALATLTDNGESAEEAATRLRMSVTLMDAPSNQAAKVLHALGLSGAEVKASTAAATQELANAHVTTTQLADDMRKPDGLNVALEDLQKHLEKSGLSADAADAAIAKAFGGGRSDAAILTLLNNTKRTGEAFDQINKSQSQFASNVADQQNQPLQKLKDTWAQLATDMVKLGDQLLPVVVPWFQRLGDVVTNLTNWFGKLTPLQKEWVLGIAGMAALIGPTLLILGTFAGAIGNILTLTAALAAPEALVAFAAIGAALGPIAIVGGSLAALGVIVKDLSQHNKDLAGAQNNVAKAQDGVKDAADRYGTKSPQYKKAVDTLHDAQKNYNAQLHDGAQKVEDLMSKWQQWVPKVVTGAPGIIQAIAPAISHFHDWHDVTKSIGDAWNDLVKDIQRNSQSIAKDIENGIVGAFKNAFGWAYQLLQTIGNIVDGLAHIQPGSGGKPDITAKKFSQLNHDLSIPGFASGVTNFSGGLAYVHQGEVLANLPRGTDVIPAGKVGGMSGGSTTINATYNVYTQFDEEQSLRDLSWRLAGAQ